MVLPVSEYLVTIEKESLIKKYIFMGLSAENPSFNRGWVGIKVAVVSLEVYIYCCCILTIAKKKAMFYLFIACISAALLSVLNNLAFINQSCLYYVK